MLKYELRTDAIGDDRYELDLVSISCHDYYADSEKVEVRNIFSNDFKLYKGETVTVVSVIDKDDDYGQTYPVTEADDVTIMELNEIEKTFSFIADKYQALKLNDINIEMENTVLYLHFYFEEWHYFRSLENYGISFNIKYQKPNGNTMKITFSGCQVVTDTELKWRYDAGSEGIDDFMCAIFRNDIYDFVGYVNDEDEVDEKYVDVGDSDIPQQACFTDELYLKKRVLIGGSEDCYMWELYDKQCNEGTLFGVSAYRLNYKYKNVNTTTEYILVPLTSLNLPLSLETGNDAYQEQNINDKFVKMQVESVKNKAPEMEKQVYHPVFKLESTKGQPIYKPIHKIKFNLHFRKRDKEGWIVKQGSLWNGMGENSVDGDVTSSGQNKFFSYMALSGFVIDKGRQSDLLCYLGFNDSDVKYQKLKLKKSFIRLSFFDSPNRLNQNLLCYSTIYLDSGLLFSKMMRGANRKVCENNNVKGLYVVSGQTSDTRYDDLKVDREPCLDPNYFTMEDVEQYRLSSQITVSDRLSASCSEGFYLYLWTDNDNRTIPSDIYMRVEFNHAGYGRVIPMTMPYGANGVYTFDDIFSIWKNDGGWGVKKNEKYSYIHFKYVYDKEKFQHVYYLDTEFYNNMNSIYLDGTPDELEINLYEANIGVVDQTESFA